MMFVLPLISLAAAADCEDVAQLAEESRSLMLEGRQEEAHERLTRALAALDCGDRRTPEEIAALSLSEATLYFLENDLIAAKVSFVFAWRTSPDMWFPALGEDLRKLYDEAVAEAINADTAQGEIHLSEPLPRGYRAALNGVSADFPVTVDSGRYLVQIYDRQEVRLGEQPYVAPGESVQINLGELPPARRPVYLIASGASALAAGGLAAVALSRTGPMDSATSQAELDSLFRTQQITGYASYGFMGLTAAGLALHFTR